MLTINAPSYLDTQHDIDTIVRGMRVALRLSQSEPLRSLIDQTDRTPGLDHELLGADDETLARQVRARVETVYHPTSSARIGSVVDARLRVYGIEGLRVADCSVMPTVISGHTVRRFLGRRIMWYADLMPGG
jgi:choline dehydrogenase